MFKIGEFEAAKWTRTRTSRNEDDDDREPVSSTCTRITTADLQEINLKTRPDPLSRHSPQHLRRLIISGRSEVLITLFIPPRLAWLGGLGNADSTEYLWVAQLACFVQPSP